ncbi:MAG: hypothetical protein JNG84_03390 [Archangium sp.]|nr:hypothetical protein [Archangium sp.]
MRLVLVLAVVLLGCGPRRGPEPGGTYFWQIQTSALEWGACSDAPALRMGTAAIPFESNSFLVYKVDAAGKRAVSQTCPRLDVSTCTDTASGIVFDVAGTELTFVAERSDVISGTECKLHQLETWSLKDEIETMTLDISTVLSLVDSPTACPMVEASLKSQSTNQQGVEGCVLTRTLTGVLR